MRAKNEFRLISEAYDKKVLERFNPWGKGGKGMHATIKPKSPVPPTPAPPTSAPEPTPQKPQSTHQWKRGPGPAGPRQLQYRKRRSKTPAAPEPVKPKPVPPKPVDTKPKPVTPKPVQPASKPGKVTRPPAAIPPRPKPVPPKPTPPKAAPVKPKPAPQAAPVPPKPVPSSPITVKPKEAEVDDTIPSPPIKAPDLGPSEFPDITPPYLRGPREEDWRIFGFNSPEEYYKKYPEGHKASDRLLRSGPGQKADIARYPGFVDDGKGGSRWAGEGPDPRLPGGPLHVPPPKSFEDMHPDSPSGRKKRGLPADVEVKKRRQRLVPPRLWDSGSEFPTSESPAEDPLKGMPVGSKERIAEYKRRGWAPDETTIPANPYSVLVPSNVGEFSDDTVSPKKTPGQLPPRFRPRWDGEKFVSPPPGGWPDGRPKR